MHEVLCCLRLERAPHLPAPLAAALRTKIRTSIGSLVGRDRDAWASYSLRPLQVVDGPDSAYGEGMGEALEANLDHEIESQEPDGSWRPLWSWGDAWPEVWEVAEREWAGVLTLNNLRTLARFDRLPG